MEAPAGAALAAQEAARRTPGLGPSPEARRPATASPRPWRP